MVVKIFFFFSSQLIEFFPESSQFNMRFKLNKKIQAPTEIFFNPTIFYPNGFSLSVTPAGFTYSMVSTHVIRIDATNPVPDGVEVVVTLTANS
jgi:hypothetical protein